MSPQVNTLLFAKKLHEELKSLGVSTSKSVSDVPDKSQYDTLVTEPSLRKKTEQLFKDGHHARAVEEAYKLLDNIVKKRAGITDSKTGASLMQHAFSAINPLLRLNAGVSTSEKDEQLGYMSILAGCMTGIRNPRAHESDWEDTEQRALQLLVFANHLIERVTLAKKVRKP